MVLKISAGGIHPTVEDYYRENATAADSKAKAKANAMLLLCSRIRARPAPYQAYGHALPGYLYLLPAEGDIWSCPYFVGTGVECFTKKERIVPRYRVSSRDFILFGELQPGDTKNTQSVDEAVEWVLVAMERCGWPRMQD